MGTRASRDSGRNRDIHTVLSGPARPADPPSGGGAPGGREPHRQVLGAGDEVGCQPFGGTGGCDVGQAREQLAQERLNLDAGDVRTETEVRTTASEGDVLVRRASDVEAVGLGEGALVAVGGA